MGVLAKRCRAQIRLEIDAKLLDDGALELDDAHLQHHLVALGDLQKIENGARRMPMY